ncbi:hypothetical protein NSND_30009 [Nitrospira sp. ND1]|mgnify:CR=1 FL=1|jgi:transposase|nr:hypothetical protein NSND_30009 [Nitrospira sp. ND1]
MKPLVCVGIDVSKAQLDVAVRPKGSLGLPHDETGIVQVVKYLQPLAPTLIVLEATGGLELPLTGALAAAGLPVVVVPPVRCEILRKPPGSWPRRIGWMPTSWHALRR